MIGGRLTEELVSTKPEHGTKKERTKNIEWAQ